MIAIGPSLPIWNVCFPAFPEGPSMLRADRLLGSARRIYESATVSGPLRSFPLASPYVRMRPTAISFRQVVVRVDELEPGRLADALAQQVRMRRTEEDRD